jgi:hypothetical protein
MICWAGARSRVGGDAAEVVAVRIHLVMRLPEAGLMGVSGGLGPVQGPPPGRTGPPGGPPAGLCAIEIATPTSEAAMRTAQKMIAM